MPHVLLIQGKPETIWDAEQFARMLDEKLGSDAADFFRDTLHEKSSVMDETTCLGECECDRVYETQEHYEAILQEMRDELLAWPIRKLSKIQIEKKRDAMVNMVDKEL